MSIRLKRLYNDYEELKQYTVDQNNISIRNTVGEPPEKYQVEYRIKGLEMKGGEVVEKSSHLVEIVLPLEYPTMEPKCRMLTPVFHPNISPQVICHTDHWAAGESLVDVVVRIGEMISYQNYNIKSPRNGEAARWAENNSGRFPIDTIGLSREGPQTEDLIPQYSEEKESTPDARSLPERPIIDEGQVAPEEAERKSKTVDFQGCTCANCGVTGQAASFYECSKHHVVCSDCVLTCNGCGAQICVLCHFSQCSSCKSVLCEECAMVCPSCRRPFCNAHSFNCSVCQTVACRDCVHICSACQKPFCESHFLETDELCFGCMDSKKNREARAAPDSCSFTGERRPESDPASPSTSVVLCSKCKNVIEYWNARFCPFCGTELQ